jgi:Uri superfamily endonuclease
VLPHRKIYKMSHPRMCEKSSRMQDQGAYVLHLNVDRTTRVRAGSLDLIYLPAGKYLYVGSARRGITARVERHTRLAERKAGKLHWHIDYLLTHRNVRLTGHTPFSAQNECDVSRRIAALELASAPVPHFGSSDCRSGCKSHLYFIETNSPLADFISGTQNQRQDNSKEKRDGKLRRAALP